LEAFDALSLCAEIGIAITGFSGVVLVFGERAGRLSERRDRFLFRTLFTGSLIPLAIVAIAFILEAAAVERATTWRASSLIHLLGVSAASVFNIRAMQGARSNEPERSLVGSRILGALALVGALIVVGLQVVNVFSFHSFWPVLVAVWWGLAVSLAAFVALLFPSRAG
jgi:hypothetical protein